MASNAASDGPRDGNENGVDDAFNSASVSSLSVVTASPIAAVASHGANQYSFPGGTAKADPNALDFIGTTSAVKKLFSMSLDASDPSSLQQQQQQQQQQQTNPNRKPTLLAVHNFNGTLIIDDAEDESNYERYASETGLPSESHPSGRSPYLLPPSSPSLALALSPSESSSSSVAAAATGNTANASLNRQHNPERSDALSLLSNVVGSGWSELAPSSSSLSSSGSFDTSRPHSGDDENDAADSFHHSRALLAPPKAPREYLRWSFRDLNLLLGHDALIVRPQEPAAGAAGTTASTATTQGGITVRVEDVEFLRTLLDAVQRQQQQQKQQSQTLLGSDAERLSYAQALLQTRDTRQPATMTTTTTTTTTPKLTSATHEIVPKLRDGGDGNEVPSSSLVTMGQTQMVASNGDNSTGDKADTKKSNPGFSEVPLQTCIVPYSGPLGARLSPPGSTSSLPPSDPAASSPGPNTALGGSSLSPSSSSSPAISIVLDAYLDNLMANVPQLALCLQEKGLVQSVKLLSTEDIPSKMLRPSTLDTSRPVDFLASSKRSATNTTSSTRLPLEEEIFSPQIMEMNASALLRFLKTHCTENHSTYLLKREWTSPDDSSGGTGAESGFQQQQQQQQQNIHLYDISSISTQKQKKWIWWLATVSHRFALRLRHLESSSASPVGLSESQKRAIRDRQRSLFQQTLDLLQDLNDIDGNAHESMVASVREHMADTFLSGSASEEPSEKMSPVSKKSSSSSSMGAAAAAATTSKPSDFSPSSSPPVVTVAASSQTAAVVAAAAAASSSRANSSSSILPSRSMKKSLSAEYLPRTVPSQPDAGNAHNPHDRHQQPYASVSIDKLNKAQDHLVKGINTLSSLFEKDLEKRSAYRESERKKQEAAWKRSRRRQRQRRGSVHEVAPQRGEEKERERMIPSVSPAMILQLFGMNFKLVNISLRLAEHHLANYYSSSAMQALRTAACRLKDAAHLLDYYKLEMRAAESRTTAGIPGTEAEEDETRRESLQLQYIWLLEHCGHFARSFASDDLWRDRGHASGEDVISVLADVEAVFVENSETIAAKYDGNEHPDYRSPFWEMVQLDVLSKTSKGRVGLQSLSGIVAPPNMDAKQAEEAIVAAQEILGKERTLQRERRRVLVASCVSYSRAITAFQYTMRTADPSEPAVDRMVLLNLLRQRLGDACNETGKVLLAALRTLLVNNQGGKKNDGSQLAAEALLDSAEFWFTQGLDAFEACRDTRNRALIRCNLCQSYKLRANSGFSKGDASSTSKHAEDCLQHAADQLLTAHEDLGQRDVDPQTWDMVSEELAATFLVLGVRRRQSLLGSGNAPVIFQIMRLSPGQERSIVDPMERALKIYEQSNNAHQAAAVHYQLAQTYSKLWTCQLNETNTRKKLSKAFEHYSSAFTYFSNHSRGNEPTFCLLCLDLASLYAAIPGEEGLIKSLGCCLDCCDTFSMEAIEASTALAASTAKSKSDWYDKMETIAQSLDDRVFKLLRSLVKIDSARYKDLYREGLTAKIVRNVPDDDEFDANPKSATLLSLHDVLLAVKKMYGIIIAKS